VLRRTLGVPLFQEQLLRIAMIAAGFSGGQAEELRRAFGFKRSEKRMKEVEAKLRSGMDKNGITGETQNRIIQSITSFALYGFPESHAASFALIAFSSAYLKCHYLAAFTAAMLNNQPMGFYQPATLVQDAQRHGLKVRPIDITCSDWPCTLEKKSGKDFHLRLGLRYARGLREEIGRQIARERAIRPFTSIEDLKLRVPWIRKVELTALAQIGALNFIDGQQDMHRRDALWQIARIARPAGPLLERARNSNPGHDISEFATESESVLNLAANPHPATMPSPLQRMTPEERLLADFNGTGMTVGPHPMGYHRQKMKRLGVLTAVELRDVPNGRQVRIAGAVICRQRPGTAKGFVFLSIEDETGIANAIITPPTFEKYHVIVVHQPFLIVEGQLQNQENVVSVKVEKVFPLSITRAETASHDFH
jgi:error-prone DNA polymerase